MEYDFFKRGSFTFFNQEAILANGTDFPLMLNIEPTNACNCACIMCTRTLSDRPIGYMSMELLKKIIDEAVTNKKIIKWLTLHKDGESTLHPKLPEMVAYAKQSGAVEYVHFNTNALPLKKSLAKKLIEAGLDDMTISVDAATEETYYKIKQKKGLHKVIENTKQLMAAKQELGSKIPWVRAKIIDMDITHHEIDDFIKFWTPLVDEVQVQAIHNAAGDLDITNKYLEDKRYPCSLLWYSTAINWDGTVSPCCVDLKCEKIMGDVNTELLSDIFSQGKIEHYRKMMLENKIHQLKPCAECNAWKNGVNLWE